jgi:hypothetical protein
VPRRRSGSTDALANRSDAAFNGDAGVISFLHSVACPILDAVRPARSRGRASLLVISGGHHSSAPPVRTHDRNPTGSSLSDPGGCGYIGVHMWTSVSEGSHGLTALLGRYPAPRIVMKAGPPARARIRSWRPPLGPDGGGLFVGEDASRPRRLNLFPKAPTPARRWGVDQIVIGVGRVGSPSAARTEFDEMEDSRRGCHTVDLRECHQPEGPLHRPRGLALPRWRSDQRAVVKDH